MSTNPRILRRAQVLDRLGVKKSALYNLIAAGGFPRPIKLSPRAVGWVEAEVDDWIAKRIAERDQGGRL